MDRTAKIHFRQVGLQCHLSIRMPSSYRGREQQFQGSRPFYSWHGRCLAMKIHRSHVGRPFTPRNRKSEWSYPCCRRKVHRCRVVDIACRWLSRPRPVDLTFTFEQSLWRPVHCVIFSANITLQVISTQCWAAHVMTFFYLILCIVGDRQSDELQCASGDELITQVGNVTYHDASSWKLVP